MEEEKGKNKFRKLEEEKKDSRIEEIEMKDMQPMPLNRGNKPSDAPDSEEEGYEYSGEPRQESSLKATLLKYKFVILPFVLFIFMNLLYYISNGSLNCDFEYHFNDCVVALRKAFPGWLGECSLAAIIWVGMMIGVIHKIFHRAWAIVLVLNLLGFFFFKLGMTANEHGSLNRVIFVFVGVIAFLVYGFIISLIFLYKKNTKIFWAVAVVLVSLWLVFYFTKLDGSCDGWENGLGAASIDNSQGHCKVPIPTTCELEIRNGALAVYKLGSECEQTKNTFNFDKLPPKLQEKKNSLKKIGYPRVEDYASQVKLNQNTFREYVFANYFDMDDPEVSEETKNNTEFYIDLEDPDQHKIVFELKPNSTRAEEQKKVYEETMKKEKDEGIYDQRVDKNMLILYIDNLSRAHFYRKMPLTAAWLDQYFEDEESEYSSYQFFRYHGVYFNTQFSNSALWYGAIHEVENTSTNIFDSFQRHGYVTGFFKDSCETRAAEIRNEDLKIHRFDHFGGEISCDDNFDRKQVGQVTWFEGKGSSMRHCLYSQSLHNIQIEYLKQFWEAYPDNRKLFRTHFSEAHEGMGELIEVIDEDFRDLLQHFLENGYLDDTLVTIVSDHGAHGMTLKLPIIPDNSRDIENYYPVLFHFSKNDMPESAGYFMKYNEQSFITPHDIYETLNSIAENKRTENSEANSHVYTQDLIARVNDCTNKTVFSDKCFCKH